MQYVVSAYTGTLGVSEFFFAARLADPKDQNVKTSYFDFWSGHGMSRDFSLETLAINMDWVHLDESFRAPPRHSR